MDRRLMELARGPGGPGAAAAILARMEERDREAALADLTALDPALARLVRERMFTFEDLGRLDVRALSLILRSVAQTDLVLALRGVAEEKREAILAGLSERARALAREDTEALGPQRAADVEEARRRILKTAHSLEAEGRLRLMPEATGR